MDPQPPVAGNSFPRRTLKQQRHREDMAGVLHSIDHVKQEPNECGIACIDMCLGYRSKGTSKPCPWHPQFGAWAIDMAATLADHGWNVKMFSKGLGFIPSWLEANEKKFPREDKERLEKMFADRAGLGDGKLGFGTGTWEAKAIPKIHTHQEIFELLGTGPVIVAVDDKRLTCVPCRKLAKRGKCANHWVVVVGFDKEKDLVFYRNPMLAYGVCQTSVGDFNKARMSELTDGDLIVVGQRGE